MSLKTKMLLTTLLVYALMGLAAAEDITDIYYTKTPGFEIIYGIVGLLAVFLYKRKIQQ